MSSVDNLPSKGIAAALAAFPFTGILGIDKYYSGTSRPWWIQLVLSLTIIGLFISGPWAIVSWIVLVFAILYGSNKVHSTLYPGVKWAPISSGDKTIAYIIIGLWLLSVVGGMFFRKTEPYKNIKSKYTEEFTYRCSKCNKYDKCEC
jgi:hypothetical protein